MNLLQAGNDVAVIALWLGHEQVSTTSIYLHADMSQKERAIARTTPPERHARAATAPPTPARLPRSALIMPILSGPLAPAEQAPSRPRSA